VQRINLPPRRDYEQRLESIGFTYYRINGKLYWDESVCYQFTRSQIDIIDDATQELHRLCLKAVEEIIRNQWFVKLGVPNWIVPQIISSWERNDPSIYGRFDLAWNGSGHPKLLEYNADTPTALLEASVAQWYWLQDCFPLADQFNSIHEKLINFWQNFAYRNLPVYFSCCSDNLEDLGNVAYLRDTAIQGGCLARHIFIEDIGWDQERKEFVDLQGYQIPNLFKLYPWEWLLKDEFGAYLTQLKMNILEPAWKMLLSSKGILAVLWQLFEGHPNLLPAYFEANALKTNFVRKPLFSREGNNIVINRGSHVIETGGRYGQEGFVYQAFHELPQFAENFPVIGSWVVNHVSAGIGIREDNNPITTDTSRFVPHYFVED